MAEDQYEHARQNARRYYEEIRDLYRKQANPSKDKYDQDSIEAIYDTAQEMPLSVLVRGPWHIPGAKPEAPAEYEILLTTGGPGLRVWGELTEHGEPDNAQLQMQDWGVPWREVWPCEVEEMDEAWEVLLWFAGQFYFGE